MEEPITVKFYDQVEDKRILFVTICAKYCNQWIWVKHKMRNTWEIPGRHREKGESVKEAACRELMEETGASSFVLQEVIAYGVTGANRVNASGEETHGMLYYAQITELGKLQYEIDDIMFHNIMPVELTYPMIQPVLFHKVNAWLIEDLGKRLDI